MTELLHITERALWEAARESGTYEMSTRGRTLREVGFIHSSLRHQLPPVARALYGADPGPTELVVLVIDSDRLNVPVRYEPADPGAQKLPHIYGPLPVSAVVDVEPWRP
ncbi:DUF952 domain-containing protein [Streptomyces boncukensis]|uniref:DUF952 domain-containing protein n=1 Tax=Streptomyces boncukensis TaxID=2711219 RepID=A0A6G4X2G3_9ACTN|nr:DUF952 domain-containing protein [Streptomyces boncukensis]NGO70851.1 DUF952 domain-containing protein [Streptomyces boncukensis]